MLLLLVMSCCSYLPAQHSSGKAFRMIQDLSYDWQVYDNRYNAYVPFVATEHQESNQVSLWVSLHKFRSYHLYFQHTTPLYIFINQKLVHKSTKAGWHSLSVDSLWKQYKKAIFITFYAPEELTLSNTSIGTKEQYVPTIQPVVQKKPTIVIEKRTKSFTHNFAVILFWVFLANTTLLWNTFPGTFYRFLHFRGMLSFGKFEENPFANKSIGTTNVLFLLSYALTTAIVLWLILNYYRPIDLLGFGNLQGSWQMFGLQVVVAFGFVLLNLLIKYLTVYALGHLFNLRKAYDFHFYEYIRISWWIYGSLLPVLAYFVLAKPYLVENMTNGLLYAITLLYFLRVGYISLHLNKVGEFRNIYLFSYLCASEFIPLVFYLKVIILS
ncbi:MAG: DUF4271 domain-containing protein [Thermonemataceae bacterium]